MKVFNFFKLLHKMKIKYKLFFAYFMVTIIPISAIGYFSYSSSVKYIEEQSLDVINQYQKSTISAIEKRLDSYIFLANTIYDNQRIQNLISGTYNDYYEEFDTANSFLVPVLQSLLNATGKGIYLGLIRYNSSKSEILQTNFENIISKINPNHDYLKDKMKIYHIINYDRVSDSLWMKENKDKTDQYIWKQVGDDSKYEYISLLREMKQYSTYDKKKIGMMRLTVRLADILLEEKNPEASEGFNLVFDNHHHLLSVEEEKAEFFSINNKMILQFISEYKESNYLILKDVILVKGKISPVGWEIVSVFPIAKLTKNFSNARNLTIIYCICSVFFLMAVTLYISTSFSSRIIAVTNQMQNFKKGKHNKRFSESDEDEIEFLTSVFNDMTQRINYLIKDNYQANIDKKDAQLKTLQAQINPHFLYNSMSAISRLAEIGETKEIIYMVKALAKFYRLTLNKGKDIISISDEIEQIKAYIEVYRIRKGECFNISFKIQKDILDFYTVKVILQPFVENVFEHGLNIRENPVNIIISAESQGDDIIFMVIDDGIGIPRERLSKLFLQVEQKGSSSGYGISNVDSRIKLQFGKSYGVSIYSIYGAGTTAMVTIPKYLSPGR